MSMFAKFIAAVTRMRKNTLPAAVELGHASLRSALGQPLMVDVQLMNVANVDLTKLRLAVEGSMTGLVHDEENADTRYPLAIKAAWLKGDDGRYFVRLAGRRLIDKPVVHLQVALDGPFGKISRAYDLRLPAAEPEKSVVVAPTAGPTPSPAHSPDIASPPPVGRKSQPMNPPDRRTAEQAWLDEQIARLQRVVTRLQRIAARHGRMHALQVFEAARQRQLIERIDAQALVVINATRAAQQKLEDQARQLDSLQASIAALSKDFDLPADDPDAGRLSASARSAS